MVRVYVPSRFSSSSCRKPWAEVSSGHCGGGSKGGGGREREERMRAMKTGEQGREIGTAGCRGEEWQTRGSGVLKRKGGCIVVT